MISETPYNPINNEATILVYLHLRPLKRHPLSDLPSWVKLVQQQTSLHPREQLLLAKIEKTKLMLFSMKVAWTSVASTFGI